MEHLKQNSNFSHPLPRTPKSIQLGGWSSEDYGKYYLTETSTSALLQSTQSNNQHKRTLVRSSVTCRLLFFFFLSQFVAYIRLSRTFNFRSFEFQKLFFKLLDAICWHDGDIITIIILIIT